MNSELQACIDIALSRAKNFIDYDITFQSSCDVYVGKQIGLWNELIKVAPEKRSELVRMCEQEFITKVCLALIEQWDN